MKPDWTKFWLNIVSEIIERVSDKIFYAVIELFIVSIAVEIVAQIIV